MKNWENIDQIFLPNTKALSDPEGNLIYKNDIIQDNLESFSFFLMKPMGHDGITGETNRYVEKITYHRDGSMERNCTFNIYPKEPIGEYRLLNPYGQAAIADFKKYKEEINEEEEFFEL